MFSLDRTPTLRGMHVVPFARLIAADLGGHSRGATGAAAHIDVAAHIDAATQWLIRAHDATPDDGVSYGYSLRGGWRPSYRETTGYIAVTFFDLASDCNEPSLRDRALRMCRWECQVQNADGSFSNPAVHPGQGIVFDTGQVLLGLTRAQAEAGDESVSRAAQRAADWLVDVADADGRWTRNTFRGIPHVYNARVAWALAAFARARSHPGSGRWEAVARVNLDWALSQEHRGFFDNCAFELGVAPYTHTIAYAIRGLLEAGRVLDEARYLEAAERCALATLAHVRDDGFIPGQIDAAGRAAASYCCLTGNCQLAIIWAKLYRSTGNERFREAAVRALGYVARVQDLHTSNADLRGAIKGSHPVWGKYSPLTFPNWATKFFIDAMLLCRDWI
jgi:hypothetical protein